MSGKESKIVLIVILLLHMTCIHATNAKSVYVPLNISFTHGIGLGESLSRGREVHSTLMINMLTGRVDHIHGIVVGGLYNQVRKEARGVLIGGISTIVGGDHQGIAISGICNVTKRGNGLQIGGIATIHSAADVGFHIAGVSAITHGNFSGLQIGGINSITQDCRGVQISGIVNRARNSYGMQLGTFTSLSQKSRGLQCTGGVAFSKEIQGAQLSTISSVSRKMEGLSLSGISSVAGTMRGAQVSVANIAQEVEGVQLGLVNIAGKNNGYPIGLVSIDRSYKPGFISWIDDQLFINTGIESGSRKLYNIFFFGFRPHQRGAHSLGVALGHSFAFSPRLHLKVDVTAELIRVAEQVHSSQYWENFQNKIRIMPQLSLTERLSLLGGLSLNTTVSEEPEGLYFLKSRTLKHRTFNSNNNLVTIAPGFMLGLSIR